MNEQELAYELMGDQHQMTSAKTPLRIDAFVKSDEEKIGNIAVYFQKIMEELGLDLEDDSLKGTPFRVAKMYVKEMFGGLNPAARPVMSVFDNKYAYNKLLVERNISFYSACEHHFLPIVGLAHIGYISNGKVVGLSKLNRIVQYYGRRPQVQERMTIQVYRELVGSLQTEDVIVVLEAEHMCVSTRGVGDPSSRTTTLEYGGVFTDIEKRTEFLNLVKK